MSASGPPRLSVMRYLGPWPLRPVPVAIALWIFFLGVASGVTFLSTQADTRQLPRYLLGTVASAVVGGAVLWVWKRWLPAFSASPLGYALAIITTGAITIGFRFATRLTPEVAFSQPPFVIAFAFIRIWILILIVLILLGVTERRLRFQAEQTEEALRIAREQQAQILQADERVREQTASFLHDRVQAGLIAACLELQAVASTPDRDPERIRAVVGRLEQLRAMDVRRAARNLSPNLAEVDLLSALEALGGQYSPGMRVHVEVEPCIDEEREAIDPRALLGVFRIVEQALLNAAVHGRASESSVSIHWIDDRITVQVADNGVGLPAQPAEDGLGSMLMTLWTRTLEGSWSWAAGSQGGVVLTAEVRVAPSHL